MGNDDTLLDRVAIRELVESWMIFRDNREWDSFLELWHDDGVMMTTWGGKASPQQFVEMANKGFADGNRVLHFCSGVTVRVDGDRGFAMSKMRIMQRGMVEGVLCDATCIGLNFDFVERREGRWGIVLRQPVYERDHLAPTDPNQTVHLNPEIMARRPDGYQRLAYLQEGLGHKIVPDMPTEVGPRREALVKAREAWMHGEPLTWPA
jgi:hypothetical protein